MNDKPEYSTWIRKKKILTFWLLTIGFLSLSLTGFLYPPLFLLGLLALPFAWIAIVISLTAWHFSPRGGDLQNFIHSLIIDAAERTGSTLDIGCGNGNLIIKLAKQNPDLRYFAIDYWGNDWEYSAAQCARNAELEGVPGITFTKASASRLPFDDASMDNVVSCLTFHEVQDVADKTESLTEALRVLKQGGSFVFFDLFADPSFYPDPDRIRIALESAGGEIESLERLGEIIVLPFPLNTPRVLKYAVLITGRKKQGG